MEQASAAESAVLDAAALASAPLPPEEIGWAGRTLDQALGSAVLTMTGGWQLLVVAVVAVSTDVADHRAPLLLAHLALAALAVAVRADRAPLWVLATGIATMLPVDWAVSSSIDSAFTFAAAWAYNLGNLLPGLLMRGHQRLVFSVAFGLAVPVGLAVVQPDWVAGLAVPALVTGLAIRSAGRLALPMLTSLAADIDREHAQSWNELRAAEEARGATAEAAARARTLHDTVINTLAVVASGGAGTSDEAAVRSHCAADLRTLDRMIAARPLDERPSIGELGRRLALDVRTTDLDAAALDAELDRLPVAVADAVAGAIGEAMRNVAKHASSTVVELEATATDGRLAVAVRDRGRGFDGSVPDGRGLAESILGRTRAVGIDATIQTAPGHGTTISLTTALDRSVPALETEVDLPAALRAIQIRAAVLWTAALVAVGIAIEAVNRFGILSPTYLMLSVVAAGAVLAWRCNHDGRLPIPAMAVLAASVPVAFVAAVAGTGYGLDEVILWQAIGVSGPLILLLVHEDSRQWLRLAVAGLVAASATTATIAAGESTQVAAVIAVGTFPPLAVLVGWLLFTTALEQVGARVAEEHQAAAAARIELAARAASNAARARWRDAGLDRSRALLGDLAAGTRNPDDPATRAACADEEAYLRQLILLDPELRWLGDVLARSLAAARARGVRLSVRTGSTDVDGPGTAAQLGLLVDTALASTPTGSTVTVTLLSTRDQLRFGIAGPTPDLARSASGWAPPNGWTTTVATHGPNDLVEVTSPRPLHPTGAQP
ncbi:MAG: ATP-binding protein [Acidimicrobiales bacterium]|nr:ATP-binding protein [Acidimicrobiales bacterium]